MPDNQSFKEQFLDTGLITDVKLWCFGNDPIVSPVQVAFAAGAKMFSLCAAISFKCPKVEEHNTFKIVFCAKLHSKIERRDPSNKSTWYIWQPIGDSGCLVIDPDKFEKMTGIDVYAIARTQEFKKFQRAFKKLITFGIHKAIDLKSEVPAEDHNEYNSYIRSLEEATNIITEYPTFMEKSYKLINYDRFTDEIKKRGYEDELKKRGNIMTQYNKNIGKKFVDKVKKNALKTGEQDRADAYELKNNGN